MENLMQILTEACPGVEFDGQTALIDDGILGSLDIVTIVSEIMEENGGAIKASSGPEGTAFSGRLPKQPPEGR